MRTRLGFVSNSSASSFLVMYNAISDLDWIKAKNENVHKMVLKDMKRCGMNSVEQFFEKEAEHLCHRLARLVFEHHKKRNLDGIDYDMSNADEVKKEISDFCEMTGCDQDEVTELVLKEIQILYPQRMINLFRYENAYLGDIPCTLGQLAMESLCSKWRNAAVLDYWLTDKGRHIVEDLYFCAENNGEKSRIFI